jgi:hypothetical protein
MHDSPLQLVHVDYSAHEVRLDVIRLVGPFARITIEPYNGSAPLPISMDVSITQLSRLAAQIHTLLGPSLTKGQ